MKRHVALAMLALLLPAHLLATEEVPESAEPVDEAAWVHRYTQCGGDWADLPPDLTSALLVATTAHQDFQAKQGNVNRPSELLERLSVRRRRSDGALLVSFAPSSMYVRDGVVTYVVDPQTFEIQCTIRDPSRDCVK